MHEKKLTEAQYESTKHYFDRCYCFDRLFFLFIFPIAYSCIVSRQTHRGILKSRQIAITQLYSYLHVNQTKPSCGTGEPYINRKQVSSHLLVRENVNSCMN